MKIRSPRLFALCLALVGLAVVALIRLGFHKTAKPPPPKPKPPLGVIVLCYHRFEETPGNFAVTPGDFERQMQTLRDRKIPVIPMRDFLAWRRGEKRLRTPSAVITIDDGYISGYKIAWPILKKYRYPFTLFVYINYIGVGGKAITWEQLAEMRDAGVDIQSHTYSHQNLRGTGALSEQAAGEISRIGYEAWLTKEIAGSKEMLEHRLGIRVNALAYPYGFYSSKVEEEILHSGYEAAFTVFGQRNELKHPVATQIGRYAINSKHPEVFQAALHALFRLPSTPSPSASPSASATPATKHLEPKVGELLSSPSPTPPVTTPNPSPSPSPSPISATPSPDPDPTPQTPPLPHLNAE